MTEALLERKLDNIERLLKVLVTERTPEWIPEKKALEILNRSKCWLKNNRLGVGDIPPTLLKDKDWHYINGRTPEYRIKSIEELKKLLIKS